MTFRVEDDRWTTRGRNLLAPEKMAAIRRTLEQGPVIFEHWYYRAARSPRRLIFDDFEDFEQYLREEARPGDAFHVWEFASLCRDDNTLAKGKYSDSDGCVPETGAYGIRQPADEKDHPG